MGEPVKLAASSMQASDYFQQALMNLQQHLTESRSTIVPKKIIPKLADAGAEACEMADKFCKEHVPGYTAQLRDEVALVFLHQKLTLGEKRFNYGEIAGLLAVEGKLDLGKNHVNTKNLTNRATAAFIEEFRLNNPTYNTLIAPGSVVVTPTASGWGLRTNYRIENRAEFRPDSSATRSYNAWLLTPVANRQIGDPNGNSVQRAEVGMQFMLTLEVPYAWRFYANKNENYGILSLGGQTLLMDLLIKNGFTDAANMNSPSALIDYCNNNEEVKKFLHSIRWMDFSGSASMEIVQTSSNNDRYAQQLADNTALARTRAEMMINAFKSFLVQIGISTDAIQFSNLNDDADAAGILPVFTLDDPVRLNALLNTLKADEAYGGRQRFERWLNEDKIIITLSDATYAFAGNTPKQQDANREKFNKEIALTKNGGQRDEVAQNDLSRAFGKCGRLVSVAVNTSDEIEIDVHGADVLVSSGGG